MSYRASRQSTTIPAPVALTLWIYSRLLIVHPPTFRHDFGDDILQVYRQTCLDAYARSGTVGVIRLWAPSASDLICGAIAEYALLLHIRREAPVEMKYRRSSSAIFACFIAFVFAGIGYSKMSEDVMKSGLPATYPLFSISYLGVEIGAIIALLGVLAGGIPIFVASLRFALAHGRHDIIVRYLVPPIALVVTLIYLGIIAALGVGGRTPATIHSWQRIVGIGSVVLVFLLAALASTAAVLDAVRRSEIDRRLLRFSLIPGAVAISGMVLTLVSHVVWSLALWQDAPNHFFGYDGFLASSTLVAIALEVTVMAVAVLLAIWALLDGVGGVNAHAEAA